MSKRLARCDECKRRKRSCQGTGDSCEYCTKKGVECVFSSFRIVEFEGGNKRVKRETDRESLTKSKLLSFIKDILSKHENSVRYMNNSCAHLNYMVSLSLHLPLIKSHIISNSSDIVVIVDQNIRKLLFNDSFTLNSMNISSQLVNFVMSCTRVDHIDLSGSKTPLTIESIKEFLSVIRDIKTLELIKKKFSVVDDTSTGSKVMPVIKGKTNISIKSKKFTSFADVNFVVDFDQIHNLSGVEECGLRFDNNDSSTYNLNVPIELGLDVNFMNFLFEEFCDTKGNLNHYLNVCLPIIIGSTISMNSAIVLSFYKLKNKMKFTQIEHKLIDELYLYCLQDLQNRLFDYSSIACDHTLITLLLLLNVELIRGARGGLWGQLITLSRYCTSFRGGLQNFASDISGLCMAKLFTTQLCLAFFPLVAEEDDPIGQYSLADFFFIIDSQPELNFYDDVSFFNDFTLVEMRDVVKTIGHISYLESFAKVCYHGNSLSVSKDNDNSINDPSSRFESYEYINEQNLSYVLSEARSIESHILENLLTDNDPHCSLPSYYQVQLKFILHSSLLYISQIIYKQTSKSPKTMLIVKELCLQLEDLFNELLNIDYKSNNISVFTLPFVLIGVDLFGGKVRDWFKSKLMELYLQSKKEGVFTCVLLLEEVWELNKDGNTYVNWRELSKEKLLRVCLHC